MVGGLRGRAANDSGAEAPAYHPVMRKLMMLAPLLAMFLAPCALATTLRDGDIIFHTSRSAQSAAIQHATHSRYSHVGLILFRDGKPYVLTMRSESSSVCDRNCASSTCPIRR